MGGGEEEGDEEGGRELLFWTYLALGVTLQLLSLLSLAGRLKRTGGGGVGKEKEEERWRTGRKEEDKTDKGRPNSVFQERIHAS